MTDRQEIGNGETIGIGQTRTDADNAVILCEPNDMTVSVADGANPGIFFDNAPSWVQGHDNNDHITTEYFTHTLTGGAFTGKMRLVKQGDGILVLPKVTETYTGPTEVWAGTLRFDGTMQNSKVWLNRFAVLESDGGKFQKEIRMDYGSELRPGGKDKTGSFEAEEIWMGFGSRLVFDVMSDGSADCIKTYGRSLMGKDWQNGPKYSMPVFEIVRHGELAEGKYLLMEVSEILDNTLDDIVLEGVDGLKASLVYEYGKVYLNVEPMRAADDVVWDGGEDGIWNLADKENFLVGGNKDFFVTDDKVTFNDQASNTVVKIEGEVKPASVVFDNSSKDFTVEGSGSIIGDGALTKRGTGNVTVKNVNKFTGGVNLEDGKIIVGSLANNDGVEYGALGGVDNMLTFQGGTLANSQTIVTTQPVTMAGQ
jgi:autotransporter-associated beta strand protein